jgi:RNA polymerase sigma-70 factor (ECF subfamily)
MCAARDLPGDAMTGTFDAADQAPSPSRDAVVILLLQHKSMLQAFIFSLIEDWVLTEDVIQETAVYICNHWQDFTPGSNFAAWARAVARLRCHEVLNAEIRQRALKDKVRIEFRDEAWDEHVEVDAERKGALVDCVDRLPERAKAILLNRYHEDRSWESIAAELEMRLELIYVTMSRIRQKLRECVERKLAQDPAS